MTQQELNLIRTMQHLHSQSEASAESHDQPIRRQQLIYLNSLNPYLFDKIEELYQEPPRQDIQINSINIHQIDDSGAPNYHFKPFFPDYNHHKVKEYFANKIRKMSWKVVKKVVWLVTVCLIFSDLRFVRFRSRSLDFNQELICNSPGHDLDFASDLDNLSI